MSQILIFNYHLIDGTCFLRRKIFISSLASLDNRELQFGDSWYRQPGLPPPLSCPVGNDPYLILRESVWLCLHLDEAGWMPCLMLSLLLSTTAGSEEPFITTSALERGKKNTKVDKICEPAHDKSNSFVFARA